MSKRGADTLRAIQMVFQNPDATLDPARTAGAILARAVKRLGGLQGDAAQQRVAELAGRVRVETQRLEARPGELSGGQKQRIAIARAFAGQPALVVCDEPASALDVSVQASILNLLAELQATEGVSYIFISHDLAVVRYLSDRIAVMYLAKLMELGGAEEGLQATAPPLHRGPDVGHPDARLRAPVAAHRAARTGAEPERTADRLPLHTRCHRFLGDICVEQTPPWREVAPGHNYLCHIAPAELRDLQLGGHTRE